MRCNICDTKLKIIIPDPSVRGGIRPCNKCQGVISATSFEDNLLGYDESDVTIDIKGVVGDGEKTNT